MSEFYAHTLENRPPADWERMAKHEAHVTRLCRLFLRRIDPSLAAWADVLGGWHDLGKYQKEFQDKLLGQRIAVDHSGPGAVMVCQKDPKKGLPAAFAIAGHHTGLANASANDPNDYRRVTRVPLQQRLKANVAQWKTLFPKLPTRLTRLTLPALPPRFDGPKEPSKTRSLAFFTRMLFSVLVDADRLATAEFCAKAEGRVPERRRLRYDRLEMLRDRLDAYVDRLAAEAATSRPSAVNALRAEVLAACRRAACEPPGLFSLTVPTGGGKTLSAMSFGLRHAVAHGLYRVIVVIPYTSIIDQNAREYRLALGIDGKPDSRNVLEHHSGIDERVAEETNREAELRRRLAAENWDAPIVVSTAVQFFESLYSDHPSRCRKVHRMAKSVIILDEVQTLPPNLLAPILDALQELTQHYGSTVVLSTATPPALAARDGFPKGLSSVRPIIADPTRLAASPAARRVRIEWRLDRVTPYEELAKELATQPQVLVVVHRREDARLLAQMLPPQGRFHLSALMCPAHRLQKIDQINEALKQQRVCRIVSTQLIEAGVNLDLPVVYRALAGLDSLVQCAGRCDREGRLTEMTGQPAGRLIVFRAETPPPGQTLKKALQSTETLLAFKGGAEMPDGLDPFNPMHCEWFFRELYGKVENDPKNIQREAAELNFANVAAAFQMIDDGWSRPVVVPWGEGLERIAAFQRAPSRETARALQPCIVQIPARQLRELVSLGVVEPCEGTDLHVPTALFGNRYDDEFGLVVAAGTGIDPEVLTV